MFSPNSFQPNWDKIISSEYVVMQESSFSFAPAGEGALTSCKKSDIFCEIDKGAVRLFDSRLQLAEETYCKILSDCRGESDKESEIEKNHEIPPDSEDICLQSGSQILFTRFNFLIPLKADLVTGNAYTLSEH